MSDPLTVLRNVDAGLTTRTLREQGDRIAAIRSALEKLPAETRHPLLDRTRREVGDADWALFKSFENPMADLELFADRLPLVERVAGILEEGLRALHAGWKHADNEIASSIVRIETPEGRVTVISPVVQKLLDKGYIWRDDVGALRGSNKMDLEARVFELGVCDFCDVTSPQHVIPTPDFSLPNDVGRSTGGWAACDICYALVNENKRAELLRRAVERAGVGKYGAAAIQELHRGFWIARDGLIETAGIGAALIDYLDNKILPDKGVKSTFDDRGKRLEAIRLLTGMTTDEVEALRRGDMAYKQVSGKLSAWHKKFGTDYDGARRIAEMIERQQVRVPTVGGVPHWQRALDAKFEAASMLDKLMAAPARTWRSDKATDLNDPAAVKAMLAIAQGQTKLAEMGYEVDAKLLRAADAYSFNGETMLAIQEAAASMPHDAPLSSVNVPSNGAGWFWFAHPMNVASSPAASEVTNALLWSWDEKISNYDRRAAFEDAIPYGTPEQQRALREISALKDMSRVDEGAGIINDIILRTGHGALPKPQVAMRFSAYVVDRDGTLLPSTRWHWPLNMTFHDMLTYSTESYNQEYGEGGKHAGDAHMSSGLDNTLTVITDLSLFFLAACLWFKEKILVQAPGHVERHARKRLQKEHKLSEQPGVRVVALRASYREPADPAATPTAEGAREYHCRWIVKGHPRLQACGPGRADRKLIWISPHPAGPSDKPLRTREKVFAVIR